MNTHRMRTLFVAATAAAGILPAVAPPAFAKPSHRAARFARTTRRLARALPPGMRFESSADFGIVSVVTAQDLRPNRGRIFRAFVSDGTRRGTFELNEFDAAQTSAPLGGPVGGRAWTIHTDPVDPSTHDCIVSLVDPVEGVSPLQRRHGFAPVDRVASGATLWVSGVYVNEFPARYVIAAYPGGETDLGTRAPGPMTVAGDGVVFAYDGGDGAGVEPWAIQTPGTPAVRLGDIRPGSASSNPAPIGSAAGLVVLAADDGVTGRELWIADAADGSVRPLEELRPGPQSPDVFLLGQGGGKVVVTADDGTRGREPWFIDPAAGSAMVIDLVFGPVGSRPADVVWTRSGPWVAATDSDGDPAVWLVTQDEPPKVGSVRGTGPLEDLGIAASPDGRIDVYALRDGDDVHWVARRADPRPDTTYDDADDDGFTDDVEIAVGTDPVDPDATPFGNARAVPASGIVSSTVQSRPGRTRVSVIAVPPDGYDPLEACSFVLDAGGVVVAVGFTDGQRVWARGGTRIVRARRPDGNVELRASIASSLTPRTDGPDGTVPVLLHVDRTRIE